MDAPNLNWTKEGRALWIATADSGYRWEIVHFGAVGLYGIAFQWADAPEWWAETLEEAKALAERLEADGLDARQVSG